MDDRLKALELRASRWRFTAIVVVLGWCLTGWNYYQVKLRLENARTVEARVAAEQAKSEERLSTPQMQERAFNERLAALEATVRRLHPYDANQETKPRLAPKSDHLSKALSSTIGSDVRKSVLADVVTEVKAEPDLRTPPQSSARISNEPSRFSATPKTGRLQIRPSPSPQVGGVYAGVGNEHWIETVTSNGKVVELEDGSVWEIEPADQIDTALWLATADVIVKESRSRIYPYLLINKDDGETAEARLLHNCGPARRNERRLARPEINRRSIAEFRFSR